MARAVQSPELLFAADLMSHIMKMKDRKWEATFRTPGIESQFTNAIGMAVDKIGTEGYSQITDEFHDVNETYVKTARYLAQYVSSLAESYFQDGYSHIKFLNFCAHATLLAVLSEKDDINGSANAVMYVMAEVLETDISVQFQSKGGWVELDKEAGCYIASKVRYPQMEIKIEGEIPKRQKRQKK